jgi:hypothetical protein
MPDTDYKSADARFILYLMHLAFFARPYNRVFILQPVKLIDRNNIKSSKLLTKK